MTPDLTGRGWRPSPAEWAIAAAVTSAMAFDLGGARSVPLALALIVPAGLSLVLRLRWPLVPLAATCLADLALQATAEGEFGPQTVVLGVIPAVFTSASLLQGRVLWWAGASSLLAIYAAHLVTREGDLGDFLPLLVWGAPWLAGRLVRRQALAAREAGARAAVLELEAREATARERDRIARELHDVVAHSVSLMVVQAGAERMALHGGAPRTTAALEAIEGTGRQALVEMRAMLGLLRAGESAEQLAPQPGVHDVEALVDEVRAAGQQVELEVEGALDRLGPGPSLAAYRVVQEALTNARRHGDGPVRVRLVGARDELRVEARNRRRASDDLLVAHDAVGADGAGRGLAGMRDRVEAFGGDLEVGPDGLEWRVVARLPLSDQGRRT